VLLVVAVASAVLAAIPVEPIVLVFAVAAPKVFVFVRIVVVALVVFAFFF